MFIMMNFSIVLISFLAMECIAWASHKYIMHGFGWAWHRDHHESREKKHDHHESRERKHDHHESHDKALEKNDLYGIFGAILSISMFAWGSPMIMDAAVWPSATWIGLGVLIYGIIYTLIHDGLVHGRYFHYVPKRGYLKRLVQAHKLHHATIGKEGGVSFSFIWARDPAALKAELKAQRDAGIAVVRDAAG